MVVRLRSLFAALSIFPGHPLSRAQASACAGRLQIRDLPTGVKREPRPAGPGQRCALPGKIVCLEKRKHETLHGLAPWSDERGAGCTADIVSGFEALVVMPEASRTRRFTRIPCGTVSKPAGTLRSSFLPVSPQMATPEPDAVTHQARTSSARSRAQGTELMPPIPETVCEHTRS